MACAAWARLGQCSSGIRAVVSRAARLDGARVACGLAFSNGIRNGSLGLALGLAFLTGIRAGFLDWHSGPWCSGGSAGACAHGMSAACSPSGPGQPPRLAIGPAMPPSGSAGPQPSGCQAGCMTSRALIHPVRWTRLQGGWLGSRSSGSLLEAADAGQDEGRSAVVGRGCCGRAVQPAFSTSNRADRCLSGIRVATPPPDRFSRISAGRRVPQKGCGARTHHPQLCSPGPYQLRYRAVEWERRDARTLRAFMGNASPFVEIPENATPSGAPIACQQPIGAPVGPAFSTSGWHGAH